MVALLPTRPAWRHPSPTTRPTSIVTSAQLLAFLLPLISTVSAQSVATTIPTRWGQASALVGNLFVVQGGKTQGTTGGGYTYNSAPSDAQMYTLDLSTSFSLASPPWQAITVDASSIAAPAVAFHTISPLNSTALLLFGGDGSPVVPVQTRNDSAYIVSLGGTTSNRTVSYQTAPTTWNQPMRRMYHSSESNGRGTVWIVGGEKADGSGIVLDQQWNADTTASSPTFQLATSSPPGSLVGATSTLLSDGTLLMLGGVDSTGQLQSLQNVYAYSTTSKAWTQTTTQVASSSTNTTSGQVARAPIFPLPDAITSPSVFPTSESSFKEALATISPLFTVMPGFSTGASIPQCGPCSIPPAGPVLVMVIRLLLMAEKSSSHLDGAEETRHQQACTFLMPLASQRLHRPRAVGLAEAGRLQPTPLILKSSRLNLYPRAQVPPPVARRPVTVPAQALVVLPQYRATRAPAMTAAAPTRAASNRIYASKRWRQCKQ